MSLNDTIMDTTNICKQRGITCQKKKIILMLYAKKYSITKYSKEVRDKK